MTLYVKGSVRWRNGDSFTGQFSDGLRHGPGLLRLDTRDLEVARLVRGEVTMMKVTSLEGDWVVESLEGPGTVSFNTDPHQSQRNHLYYRLSLPMAPQCMVTSPGVLSTASPAHLTVITRWSVSAGQ